MDKLIDQILADKRTEAKNAETSCCAAPTPDKL